MSRVNIKTCTLEELEDECVKVEGTNFGHTMIGIICRTASDRLYELYQG